MFDDSDMDSISAVLHLLKVKLSCIIIVIGFLFTLEVVLGYYCGLISKLEVHGNFCDLYFNLYHSLYPHHVKLWRNFKLEGPNIPKLQLLCDDFEGKV